MLVWLFFTNLIWKDEFIIKEYSEVFDKYYETENTLKILNTKQAGLYLKHKVPLIDIFWSGGSLVFVFNREDTKIVYDLWCKRELE